MFGWQLERGDAVSAGTTTAEASTAPTLSEGCEPATTDLMTPLGNKLTAEGARLRNGMIAESEEKPGVYYVSAELYGEGIESAVGTWVTESKFGGGAIHVVDEVAKENSDWSDAETAGFSVADPAVEASRDCVTGG